MDLKHESYSTKYDYLLFPCLLNGLVIVYLINVFIYNLNGNPGLHIMVCPQTADCSGIMQVHLQVLTSYTFCVIRITLPV